MWKKSLGRRQPSAPKLYSNAQGTEELKYIVLLQNKIYSWPKNQNLPLLN
jgi:hypothetical protein